MQVSAQTERCPYCTKKVYHAERTFADGKYFHAICLRNMEKEDLARNPRTFSISEQLFCNPKEGERQFEPQLHNMTECSKCGHVNMGNGFCIKCRAPI